MLLELRVTGEGEVQVTSRFSRYLIELEDETIWLSARGLEREYSLLDFPGEAELPAIAVYLVVQLEAQEIGIYS